MLNTMNLKDCYRAPNDRSACDSRPRRGGKGFTLAEILIALGILAIGMSMVAAIFPAAMEFNRRSTNSTLGTIICENGMVLAEMAITADIIAADSKPEELTIYADGKNENYLTKAQQHYPTGNEDSRTGFVVLARRASEAGGAYQLVTVAYRKSDEKNTVALLPISCSISGRNISVSGTGNLRTGTPVINRKTGEFAFVDSVNRTGTAGTLDIDTTKRSMSGGSAYVLVEQKNGVTININTVRRSPAIGAISKVTGLRRDPVADSGS